MSAARTGWMSVLKNRLQSASASRGAVRGRRTGFSAEAGGRRAPGAIPLRLKADLTVGRSVVRGHKPGASRAFGLVGGRKWADSDWRLSLFVIFFSPCAFFIECDMFPVTEKWSWSFRRKTACLVTRLLTCSVFPPQERGSN